MDVFEPITQPSIDDRLPLSTHENLPQLVPAVPDQLSPAPESLEWLSYFQRCSRLLFAVVEPVTLTLRYANDYLYELAGIEQQTGAIDLLAVAVRQMLNDREMVSVRHLYRRHILHQIFREFYGIDPQGCRLLEEPVMLRLISPLYPQPRAIEFWLRSEHLRITRCNQHFDEFSELELQQKPLAELEKLLADPAQLEALENQLRLDNYQIEGSLLLEGVDVTDREAIRCITQLLIDRDSVLQPQKFAEVNQQMRSLFQAENTVILTIEAEQARLFMGEVSDDLNTLTYSLDSFANSQFSQALQSNRVALVSDLAQECQTDCGRKLRALGVRSLLLIPLVSCLGGGETGKGGEEASTQNSKPNAPATPSALHPIGLVGVLSDRPHNFDGLDYRHAGQLIPAFTAALLAAQRQLVQKRLITNIHPAVEWRFSQEAERRSLGLPPEPIVFPAVYPLYGISDIRGSSDERNRAIQADLLAQFRLGLAVVEAVCAHQPTGLVEQVRLDLLERVHCLETTITVDVEVSGIRYLREHLEAYFDSFAQTGEATIAAIQTYQTACANSHGCVYDARAAYDEAIATITRTLRAVWDRWQAKMQRLAPHYCDLETTDGIDHMIYAGQAIDPNFSRFHLRSLRYEQLRAVCDCARASLRLQEELPSHLKVTHLVLVQDSTVDIFHDETNEALFDVRGSRDTRYEIVKKRIDKAIDAQTQTRITQPGMLTLVYSTEEEWAEYQQYFRYLTREGWIGGELERGVVQPLPGVNGLRYARVTVLPEAGGKQSAQV
ncbi:MAG TPA: hypothetical protein V6D18_09880 [Thermosynechococcaceae cyanobacterium]